MNKEEALDSLDTVIGDIQSGMQYAEDGQVIPWEVHGWEAMQDLLEDVKGFIQENL